MRSKRPCCSPSIEGIALERECVRRAGAIGRIRRRCAMLSSASARRARLPTSALTSRRATIRQHRRDRRGHDGRRHQHEFPQCRHAGDDRGSAAGSARSRRRDDSQELREQREERQADCRAGRAAHGAAHADACRTTGSRMPTSSSRRCSRTMASSSRVFRQLDAIAKPGAILASNTSTLDVDRIAAFTATPAGRDRHAFLQSRPM